LTTARNIDRLSAPCEEGLVKRAITLFFIILLASVVWLTPGARPVQGQAKEPPKVKVGDSAPDFKLLAFDGKDVKPVSLQDYRGKQNVVLAFYVFAFTPG
jgi:AhpC/TSA family protein